jgi:hypothetical protein
MIQTKEKQIKGAVYSVTQLPARRALRLKAKLLRLFGPALVQLFLPGGTNESMSGLPFSKTEAVLAVESLMAQLDDKTFENLVMELCQGVRKDGMELTESVIDIEFAGDLGTLMQVLWFVIDCNFGSFFGESGIGRLFGATAPIPQNRQPDTKKTSIRT